jgi:hypothetical protein
MKVYYRRGKHPKFVKTNKITVLKQEFVKLNFTYNKITGETNAMVV